MVVRFFGAWRTVFSKWVRFSRLAFCFVGFGVRFSRRLVLGVRDYNFFSRVVLLVVRSYFLGRLSRGCPALRRFPGWNPTGSSYWVALLDRPWVTLLDRPTGSSYWVSVKTSFFTNCLRHVPRCENDGDGHPAGRAPKMSS